MSKAWSKDILLDRGTFGSSKACHTIVDMMNDDKINVYEKHRVLAFINRNAVFANSISQISDPGVRHHMLLSARNEFLTRIDMEQMSKYPEEFKSFLRNVVSYIFNRALERAMRADRTIAR